MLKSNMMMEKGTKIEFKQCISSKKKPFSANLTNDDLF